MGIDDRRLLERVALGPLTTLGIGGNARFFFEANAEADLLEAFDFACARGVAAMVLGGGSNLVVADAGFDGLVVQARLRGQHTLETDGRRTLVRVGAGEVLDEWVEACVKAGLAGVECLSGIPGFVGATPIQNVGAYGQEVAETVVDVRAFDRVSRKFSRFEPASCEFGYRTSVFRTTLKDRLVICSVTFALRNAGEPAVRYPELARALGARPTLVEARRAVLAIRRSKSMLADASDPDARSAGSFFVNPVVDAAKAEALAAEEPDIPRFAASGGVKLSAAWLIERAGFPRGAGAGRVGLSTKHALALVNRGGARASELVAFAARIRDAVRARFGVALQPEPVFVGFAPAEIAPLFD